MLVIQKVCNQHQEMLHSLHHEMAVYIVYIVAVQLYSEGTEQHTLMQSASPACPCSEASLAGTEPSLTAQQGLLFAALAAAATPTLHHKHNRSLRSRELKRLGSC